jgi:hypothetical protein
VYLFIAMRMAHDHTSHVIQTDIRGGTSDVSSLDECIVVIWGRMREHKLKLTDEKLVI